VIGRTLKMGKRSTTVVGKLGGAWRFGGDPVTLSPHPIFRRTPLLDEEGRRYTETTIARSKDGSRRIVLLRPKRKQRKPGRGKRK